MSSAVNAFFEWDESTNTAKFYSRIDFRLIHEQVFECFKDAFELHSVFVSIHSEGVNIGQRQAVQMLDRVTDELRRLSV